MPDTSGKSTRRPRTPRTADETATPVNTTTETAGEDAPPKPRRTRAKAKPAEKTDLMSAEINPLKEATPVKTRKTRAKVQKAPEEDAPPTVATQQPRLKLSLKNKAVPSPETTDSSPPAETARVSHAAQSPQSSAPSTQTPEQDRPIRNDDYGEKPFAPSSESSTETNRQDKTRRRLPRNPQHGRRHGERKKTRNQESESFAEQPTQQQRPNKQRGPNLRGLWGRLRHDRRNNETTTNTVAEPTPAPFQQRTEQPPYGARRFNRQDGKQPRASRREPVTEKPERLHKLLAEAGIGSRREMEEWIIAGRVSVNSLPAHVGQLVEPGDRIRVNGKLIDLKKASARQTRVLIYHKPEGQIVSRNDPQRRDSVFDALPRLRAGRWIAIGRLDYNTSGLLLFTTSGDLANRLTHPSANLVREYAVRILGDIDDEAKHQLLDGIELEDGPARFTTLEEAGGEGANRWLSVTLYEGRNREVRRMFEYVGVTISRLMRVRYGPFILPPHLKRGQFRELEPAEIESLMQQFGAAPRSSWGARAGNNRFDNTGEHRGRAHPGAHSGGYPDRSNQGDRFPFRDSKKLRVGNKGKPPRR